MNVENSMCYDITQDSFDIDQKIYAEEQELLRIDSRYVSNTEKYKSEMIIGNITINNIKHFNWLQKLMFKMFFGIKIKDIN